MPDSPPMRTKSRELSGWVSTAEALESEPEPRVALKDEVEIESKPKRRGK
jgi:hypothetical protein